MTPNSPFLDDVTLLEFSQGMSLGAGIYSIATGTWYNARVSKSPCKYKKGAVTFYFAQPERARDQK